jgi:acetyl-CoA carboxylase biotin carboxyl carrier protein
MNPQEIKDFLKSLKETDIEELQYRSGDDTLYFKKSEVEEFAPPKPTQPQTAPPEIKARHTAIKSSVVGTFVSAASNDKPPFVTEGCEVVPGQKVGQIEAMKIIRDVTSKVKGKIVKICVSNGQSVEYGQELFLVEPK